MKIEVIIIGKGHDVIDDTSHFMRSGLAAVVGGVFSNLANAANAILSSPSKIGITQLFVFLLANCKIYTMNEPFQITESIHH